MRCSVDFIAESQQSSPPPESAPPLAALLGAFGTRSVATAERNARRAAKQTHLAEQLAALDKLAQSHRLSGASRAAQTLGTLLEESAAQRRALARLLRAMAAPQISAAGALEGVALLTSARKIEAATEEAGRQLGVLDSDLRRAAQGTPPRRPAPLQLRAPPSPGSQLLRAAQRAARAPLTTPTKVVAEEEEGQEADDAGAWRLDVLAQRGGDALLLRAFTAIAQGARVLVLDPPRPPRKASSSPPSPPRAAPRLPPTSPLALATETAARLAEHEAAAERLRRELATAEARLAQRVALDASTKAREAAAMAATRKADVALEKSTARVAALLREAAVHEVREREHCATELEHHQVLAQHAREKHAHTVATKRHAVASKQHTASVLEHSERERDFRTRVINLAVVHQREQEELDRRTRAVELVEAQLRASHAAHNAERREHDQRSAAHARSHAMHTEEVAAHEYRTLALAEEREALRTEKQNLVATHNETLAAARTASAAEALQLRDALAESAVAHRASASELEELTLTLRLLYTAEAV